MMTENLAAHMIWASLYRAAILITHVMIACYLTHTLTQRMTQIMLKMMIDKLPIVYIH